MNADTTRTVSCRSLWLFAAGALLVWGAASGEPAEKQEGAEATPNAEEKAPRPVPPLEAPALPKEEILGEREEHILIGGIPTPGRPILPATATDFRFKLALTGDVVVLRWTDLPEEERRRVQKFYGMEVLDQRQVFGDKVKGKRFTLRSRKQIAGLPIPERSRPGYVAIKTYSTPLMMIPESEIENTEEIECFESDFYSASEVYQKWVVEKPPDDKDAPAHLAMAQRCAKIGIYNKAIEHLKMAEVIDPQMGERNKEFLVSLLAEDAKRQGAELYDRLLRAKNAGDYATAFYVMETMERNFPNSDYASRLSSLKPELVEGQKKDAQKSVIQMAYTVASDLVQKKLFSKVRVDERNNVVPSIPGKQVVTRNGHMFRGTLISGDVGQDMVLKVNDMTLTIAAKDITDVRDIDLSVAAREIAPSFDELKEYCVDASRPDGLMMQMIAKISKSLKRPEAEVKDIFESRMNREGTYENGKLVKSDIYVTGHEANYGRGSWLREGAKPAPLRPNQTPQAPRNRQTTYRNRQGIPNTPRLPDPDENPELTDDPAVWWKAQTIETQVAVLRAFMAEKVFKGTAKPIRCPNCSGKGEVEVMGQGGNLEAIRCSACRGIGAWYKIQYK